VEEEMEKVKWGGGGMKLEDKKVHGLAYADDMVLLAEDEGSMRNMMKRLEEYIERKELELNREKNEIK